MLKRTLAFVISIYQYLMPILAFICLLIIPLIERHQYFKTLTIDLLVRCFLWVYFTFAYWSIGVAIKNRIYNRRDFGLSFEMRKDITSFISLSVSAIGIGAFISLLTQWALEAYIPQLHPNLRLILSLGNGVTYGALVFLQYFFLPEN
jgi:hypothetical protein